jgi:hypothetical protein
MVDLYRVLSLRKTASKDEIKSAYKKLSRQLHPDRFLDQLTFKPANMSVAELREYATDNMVGVSTLVDKAELVQVAQGIHKRADVLPRKQRERMKEIEGEFQMVTLAYRTLGVDDEARRYYDLTGDWGEEEEFVWGGGERNMGDRKEAERVRERGRKR